MVSFPETLLLSAVVGFSILLSLPVVMHRRTTPLTSKLLVAVAIGILLFILADVWGNAATFLYNGSFYGFGSSPSYDAVFAVALAVGFLVLYLGENRSKSGLTPTQSSFMISLGVGFQNLTEGLVFGALAVSIGLTGAALVVFVGFVLQNITEGFPIASPFLSRDDRKTGVMVLLFLLGGAPAILGAAVGFYYSSPMLLLLFDGLAIGAILYAVLPMLKSIFREADHRVQRVTYMGIFLGFLLGFLVNLV